MKRIAFLLIALTVAAGIAVFIVPASGHAGERASAVSSPIYGVTVPSGGRDWEVIAVNQLMTPKVDQLRARVGNEIAVKAFKRKVAAVP